jgi:hypothetical protein
MQAQRALQDTTAGTKPQRGDISLDNWK